MYYYLININQHIYYYLNINYLNKINIKDYYYIINNLLLIMIDQNILVFNIQMNFLNFMDKILLYKNHMYIIFIFMNFI